jgi:DNA (cytosine-5)-methyltransferase 1
MKYGSCFSGIEAASVAWHPLGWEGQWFSEIEPFPSAVLAHRFPNVPNLGDITNIHNDERFEKSTIDLLVGGSPCQSFSVAGLRKGLSDPRGNLMLTFLSVAERKKPRWIVWENVPGVLSSNGGRDFASFLTALAELGYGFSYRVLDAQYFGVAQRRRRVFVVGYLGDWRPTAAVLFESHSLQGNPKPSRKKREEVTAGSEGGIGEGETMSPLVAKGPHGVAHAFKVRGGSSVETGEQGGKPGRVAGKGYLGQDECVFTIQATQDQMIAQPLAVDCYNQTVNENTSQTIGSSASDVNHYGAVLHSMAIRRLTTTECERLQGFPDSWTQIPYRNKPADLCPDGPRYKACGNSMAVPVMRWIGERINLVENLLNQNK